MATIKDGQTTNSKTSYWNAPLWKQAMNDQLFQDALKTTLLKVAKANAPMKGRNANILIVDDVVTSSSHSFLTVGRVARSDRTTTVREKVTRLDWWRFSKAEPSQRVSSLLLAVQVQSTIEGQVDWVHRWQVQL